LLAECALSRTRQGFCNSPQGEVVRARHVSTGWCAAVENAQPFSGDTFAANRTSAPISQTRFGCGSHQPAGRDAVSPLRERRENIPKISQSRVSGGTWSTVKFMCGLRNDPEAHGYRPKAGMG